MRNWQRRVFTLTCDRLTYAKEDEARGFIAMEEVTAVQASDRHSIKLVTRGRTWNLEVPPSLPFPLPSPPSFTPY